MASEAPGIRYRSSSPTFFTKMLPAGPFLPPGSRTNPTPNSRASAVVRMTGQNMVVSARGMPLAPMGRG